MFFAIYANSPKPFARFETKDMAIEACCLLAREEKRSINVVESRTGRLIAAVSPDGAHTLAS